MAELADEVKAFDAMRDQLIADHGSGFAVLRAGKLFGVFESRDDAFDAALKKFGTKTTFLIRRIDADEELEAPALALGLLGAESHDVGRLDLMRIVVED